MKKQLNIRRRVDRNLTAEARKQILIFAGFFALCLVGMIVFYLIFHLDDGQGVKKAFSKVMADVLSSDKFAEYVYDSNANLGVRIVTFLSCLVGAIVFQGLLIATITNIIQSRADKVKEGNVNYSFRNHYLILGYNDKVPFLIKNIDDKADVVVAVEDNVQQCREMLQTQLDKNVFDRVYFIHANRTSEEDLKDRLSIASAKRVYIIGEENEAEHDVRNMESYHVIVDKLKAAVHCYVYAEKQSFFDLLVNYGASNDKFFHPFNYNELWARKVLVDTDNQYLKIDYRSDEDNICVRPEKYVHVVVVGMTEMGEAMARETAFLAHFPNYASHSKRTRITVIDPDMEHLMQRFVGRHLTLFQHCHYSFCKLNANGQKCMFKNEVEGKDDFLDTEFEFIEAEPSGPLVQHLLKQWSEDDGQFLSVVFCQDDDAANMCDSHYLPEALYTKGVPVWFYQRNDMQRYFDAENKLFNHQRFQNVVAFGSPDIDVTVDALEVQWAMKLNYFYNKGLETSDYDEQAVNDCWTGENTQISDRWSSIYNASSFVYRLRSVGAKYENGRIINAELVDDKINELAETEHNRWNVEKLMIGYRSATDVEKKQAQRILNMGRKRCQEGDEGLGKEDLKDNFIHIDIRPFDELDVNHRNMNMSENDRMLINELVNLIEKGRK